MVPDVPPPPQDLPSLGPSIAVSLLSLGLVCLLAYLALRWLSRRGGVMQSMGPVKVLARQGLDPRRSVFIIEAADRCFLVGAGEGSMNLLAELDHATVKRDLVRPARTASVLSGVQFGEVLGRVLGRGGPPMATVPATTARELDNEPTDRVESGQFISRPAGSSVVAASATKEAGPTRVDPALDKLEG